MARKLEIQIVGDTSSLERAFARASGQTKSFGGHLSSLGKTAVLGLGGVELVDIGRSDA